MSVRRLAKAVIRMDAGCRIGATFGDALLRDDDLRGTPHDLAVAQSVRALASAGGCGIEARPRGASRFCAMWSEQPCGVPMIPTRPMGMDPQPVPEWIARGVMQEAKGADLTGWVMGRVAA